MLKRDKASGRLCIYQPLVDHLGVASGDELVLTFAEIAARIGRRYLPESAILTTGGGRSGGGPMPARRMARHLHTRCRGATRWLRSTTP